MANELQLVGQEYCTGAREPLYPSLLSLKPRQNTPRHLSCTRKHGESNSARSSKEKTIDFYVGLRNLKDAMQLLLHGVNSDLDFVADACLLKRNTTYLFRQF